MPIDVDKGYTPGLKDAEGNIIVSQPLAGLMTRFTGEGIAVHMYWAHPGVYYGDHGQEFPEVMARAAGYDVELYAAQRKRAEAIGEATAAIEAEFQTGHARKVVETRGEYSLVEVGPQAYMIEFSDGSPVTPSPLGRDIANRVMDRLTETTLPAPKPKPDKD